MTYNPTSIVDNPTYGTHNFTPASLKYSRAALAACRANLRDFRIGTAGDSIVNGGLATTPLTENFTRRAATILGQRTGLTVRRGFIPITTFGSVDAQWTVGSGWTAWGNAIFSTSQAYQGTVGGAGTMDFTPVDDAGGAVTCDSFNIIMYAQGNVGGIQYAIDGGSYTNLANTSGSYNGFTSYNVSAGSRGTHTLHIKTQATGNVPIVLGAEAVDSQQRGIRYMYGGTNGSVTPASFDQFSGNTPYQAFGTDLMMFEWNTNDYAQQTALATFQTRVQAVAAAPATYTKPADTLWLAAPPEGGAALTIPQSSYYATLDAASDAAGFTVLHYDRAIVSYAVGNAAPLSLYGDTIHPNTAGHNAWGNMIAALLALL